MAAEHFPKLPSPNKKVHLFDSNIADSASRNVVPLFSTFCCFHILYTWLVRGRRVYVSSRIYMRECAHMHRCCVRVKKDGESPRSFQRSIIRRRRSPLRCVYIARFNPFLTRVATEEEAQGSLRQKAGPHRLRVVVGKSARTMILTAPAILGSPR